MKLPVFDSNDSNNYQWVWTISDDEYYDNDVPGINMQANLWE